MQGRPRAGTPEERPPLKSPPPLSRSGLFRRAVAPTGKATPVNSARPALAHQAARSLRRKAPAPRGLRHHPPPARHDGRGPSGATDARTRPLCAGWRPRRQLRPVPPGPHAPDHPARLTSSQHAPPGTPHPARPSARPGALGVLQLAGRRQQPGAEPPLTRLLRSAGVFEPESRRWRDSVARWRPA